MNTLTLYMKCTKWSQTQLLVIMTMTICVLNILAVFSPRESGNILVCPTRGSHWINLKIMLEMLIGRGHNVTGLVPDPSWIPKNRFAFPASTSVYPWLHWTCKTSLMNFLHFSVYETDQLNLLQIQMKFYEILNMRTYCEEQIVELKVSWCSVRSNLPLQQ